MFFDQLVFRLSRGNLKEESHYYPFGLPIAGLSSAAPDLKEQRRKYQSNEYIKDLGLNWMDFHARQYDPQIGRFLGVDPLADAQGQEIWSPYAAMGNAPESMVDPNGEFAYVSDIASNRADADMILTSMFGAGNYTIDKDDRITITNARAAARNFNAFVRSGAGGGNAAVTEMVINAGQSILNNHENPYMNVMVGFANNSVSNYSWWRTLPEVDIFSGDGSLNVAQAAQLGIGRNDYARQRADWASNTVMGWMAIGVTAPFVAVAASEAVPFLWTSFLSNPMAWTEGAGGAVMGAAGYGGESPTAGTLATKGGVTGLSSLNPTHYITKSESVMKRFVSGIKADGAINESISFVEHNGSKFIVDGHHRFFAAQKLGIQNVPVQQVQLPFRGYQTTSDLILSGKQPGWWKFYKP